MPFPAISGRLHTGLVWVLCVCVCVCGRVRAGTESPPFHSDPPLVTALHCQARGTHIDTMAFIRSRPQPASLNRRAAPGRGWDAGVKARWSSCRRVVMVGWCGGVVVWWCGGGSGVVVAVVVW